ncbi:MAG: CHAT domain-containing protein [Leptolyngbyaceae cyanobacterium]
MISNNEPLQMSELPPRDEIETTARAFYDLLTEPSGRVRPETTAQAGDALRRLLFAEVKDEINAHERLVIVGDGFLQYLPFAALPNPAPESSPSSAAMQGEFGSHLNPLLLEHEVILLPSASALVAIRQDQPNRTEPEHELAMFANPVFSHKNSEAPGIALAEGFELTPNTELDDVEVLYSELPTTAEQLADIEPLIPASDRIQYLKHDADLEAALSPELGDYRIVHFATHGIFNSRAPERSGIVLSAISEEGILQPGLLSPTYAFNGMNLDSTELVVLSGCRTGLSNSDVTREGLTGLTGGLFAAGADRVVASLWSVQDTATQELMGRFYERMLDPEINMTPAEALRDAQISMWNEPQWQTPYYWAAFTLQGEWQGWN